MKKTFKKIIIVLISLFIFIPVHAADKTEFAEASYRVDQTVEENLLPFGVFHKTDIGGSSRTQVLDPQQVSVLNIPNDENLKIVSWANMGTTRFNLTSVRNIAKDYENKNPGYRVVAAINGDFYEPNADPTGVFVANGEMYKPSPTTRNAVGFKNDGSINSIVGNKSLSITDNLILSIYDANDNIQEFIVNKINSEPLENETSVFFANRIGNTHYPISSPMGYVVEKAEHAISYSSNSFYGRGIISAINEQQIGFGEFSIVSNNQNLIDALDIGVRVRVQYQFTGAYAGVEEVIGIGRPILYNNQFVADESTFGNARHPRTMVGRKADGSIVMVVVDGRQANMTGVSQPEMAAVLHHYGAVEAYNLDGGGSSTMMILEDGDFKVVNSPSDQRERSVANALLVVARVPDIDYQISSNYSDQIIISTEIRNLHGYNIDRLYIGMNDEVKEVIGGEVVFSNLESNTLYTYHFYYKIDGKYKSLIIQDQVNTAKVKPRIEYINMYFQDSHLYFKFSIIDPDNAIIRNNIDLGKRTSIVTNNQAVFYNYEDLITNIKINYSYDLNDDKGRVDLEINNLRIRCDLTLLMRITNNYFNNRLSNIYN